MSTLCLKPDISSLKLLVKILKNQPIIFVDPPLANSPHHHQRNMPSSKTSSKTRTLIPIISTNQLREAGVHKGDVGLHSIRKSAVTYAAGGSAPPDDFASGVPSAADATASAILSSRHHKK